MMTDRRHWRQWNRRIGYHWRGDSPSFATLASETDIFSNLVPSRSYPVASNTSKTARASVRAGQSGQGAALSVLGEFKYVIPLNGGRHAYVRNLTNGRTVHLATDSDAFADEVRLLAQAGHGAKIRAELTALAAAYPSHGWDTTEKRLVEAGVLEG
jgi:hypothetical protein